MVTVHPRTNWLKLTLWVPVVPLFCQSLQTRFHVAGSLSGSRSAFENVTAFLHHRVLNHLICACCYGRWRTSLHLLSVWRRVYKPCAWVWVRTDSWSPHCGWVDAAWSNGGLLVCGGICSRDLKSNRLLVLFPSEKSILLWTATLRRRGFRGGKCCNTNTSNLKKSEVTAAATAGSFS